MFAMNAPKVVSETNEGIELEADEKTDFFVDMETLRVRDDAPFYFEERIGDFVMRAKVRPDFRSTYDAGGLFVFDSDRKWIKFAFELTDLGYPSVVSVVTDKVSDDSNGERMADCLEVWLQVARRGDNWVLHFSEDGKKWKMSRYFRLKLKAKLKVGVVAQSPLGKGCTVRFAKLSVGENRLKSMRKGR